MGRTEQAARLEIALAAVEERFGAAAFEWHDVVEVMASVECECQGCEDKRVTVQRAAELLVLGDDRTVDQEVELQAMLGEDPIPSGSPGTIDERSAVKEREQEIAEEMAGLWNGLDVVKGPE